MLKPATDVAGLQLCAHKVAGPACQLAVNAGLVESGHMEGNLILSYEVWRSPQHGRPAP
jgi:hypothetical protein